MKTKTAVIVLLSARDNIMNVYAIQRIDNAKVLGVTSSPDLITWNVHVENIIVKASKRIYMLYQLKRAAIDKNHLRRI